MANIQKLVMEAFSKLTPNLNNIYDTAHTYTVSGWKAKQKSLATASGAGAMAAPGAHLATLAADIAFLMNRMSVCSYGIGAIRSFDESYGNILEEEDFANVLAMWAGHEEITSMMGSKGALDIAMKVGGKVGMKVIGKTIATSGTVLVGKKLGGKVGAKVAAKIAGKIAGKAGAGFIPLLGPVIGGGINFWFISSVSSSAEEYYDFKLSVIKKL